MAEAILGGDDYARKSTIDTITTSQLPEHWFELPGLIADPLIDAATQVAVLAQIDETGSATLGNLMALLPDHANPAEAIIRFVRHGVLTVEPGLLDGQSLLRRRLMPALLKPAEPAGGAGKGEAGPLRRLKLVAPQPEIFFARGVDRAAFTREPYMRRKGIYMALYGNSAYVGRSGDTASRIAWGAHLRQHGLPDMVIAAVDSTDTLSEAQIMVAERQLCRMVDEATDMERRNKTLPNGAQVSTPDFVVASQFVRQVASALRDAGLAFTNGAMQASAAPEAGAAIGSQHHSGHAAAVEVTDSAQSFRLNSCGVVAYAKVENGKWSVLAGSQVRAVPAPSAGSAASRQRQELLYDGGIVKRDGHLVLTADVVFETASGAANFVVGSRHKPEIWRPDPAPIDHGPLL